MSFKTSFYSFFSPPRFLEMSATGLDISDQAIRFVEFAKNGSGLNLSLFGEKRLPQGVVVFGEIVKKDNLIDILSGLREKHSLKFVKVSLPEAKAYFFKTEIPKVEIGEIRQSIELRLEENVPLKADEVLFDYTVINKDHYDRNNHLDVSVSVVPKRVVESYNEALNKSGLMAVSFEVESKAIIHSAVKIGDIGSSMIVNIKDRLTVISVVRDGAVRFTSTFGIGGNLITEALQKNFSATFEEAEKIKEEKLYNESKESVAVFFSLIGIISAIRDEISKFYNYWLTRDDSKGEYGGKIDKIMLCGKDSAIAGLKDYLSQSIKTKVEIADVWVNAFSIGDKTPEINFFDSLNFGVAIGLSLSDKNLKS